MSKAGRKKLTSKKLASSRKAALVASGHVYGDLARAANVSYSMVDKWMNGRRTSQECQRAFDLLINNPEPKAS